MVLETNLCEPGGTARHVPGLVAVPVMGAQGMMLPLSQVQIRSAGCWDGLRLSPMKPGSCLQVDVCKGRDLS